jgi:hypothetical protein
MTEKNDEGLYAVIGTVLSWRDDTSTLREVPDRKSRAAGE